MNTNTIGEIKPMMFEGYLIISLGRKWMEQVFQKIPTFRVTMDERRLQITSEEIPQGGKNE